MKVLKHNNTEQTEIRNVLCDVDWKTWIDSSTDLENTGIRTIDVLVVGEC